MDYLLLFISTFVLTYFCVLALILVAWGGIWDGVSTLTQPVASALFVAMVTTLLMLVLQGV